MGIENLDLRILLAEKKIKQKDIAKFLGVYPSQVTRWFSYKNLKPEIKNKIIFAANYIESGRNRNQKQE